MARVILYYKNSEGGLQLLYCVNQNVCVCGGGLPMNLCDAIAYRIPQCIRTCILYSDVFVEGNAWLPSLAKRNTWAGLSQPLGRAGTSLLRNTCYSKDAIWLYRTYSFVLPQLTGIAVAYIASQLSNISWPGPDDAPVPAKICVLEC